MEVAQETVSRELAAVETTAGKTNEEDLGPVDVGMVFALSMEAGGVIDRMTERRTTKGNGFRFHTGLFEGRRVALVEAGIGREKAGAAAEALWNVFRPYRILTAGYAGGLSSSLKRYEVFVPRRFIRAADGSILEDILDVFSPEATASCDDANDSPSLTLVTCDRVVRTTAEKRKLHDTFCADLVDMETWAVVEFCARKEIPCLALRIVLDTADEELSKEVSRIADPNIGTARMLGSVVSALWRKPSSLLDLYQLKERALIATDRLADRIAELLQENGTLRSEQFTE